MIGEQTDSKKGINGRAVFAIDTAHVFIMFVLFTLLMVVLIASFPASNVSPKDRRYWSEYTLMQSSHSWPVETSMGTIEKANFWIYAPISPEKSNVVQQVLDVTFSDGGRETYEYVPISTAPGTNFKFAWRNPRTGRVVTGGDFDRLWKAWEISVLDSLERTDARREWIPRPPQPRFSWESTHATYPITHFRPVDFKSAPNKILRDPKAIEVWFSNGSSEIFVDLGDGRNWIGLKGRKLANADTVKMISTWYSATVNKDRAP
jgi:hypothetical protein